MKMGVANSTSLSIDRLRREGDRFMEDFSREYYLASSGQKASAELTPIYEKYATILGPDALAMVLEMFRGSDPGSEEHRGLRMLADWLVESQSSRVLAPLDEREITWESSAIVRLADGRQLEYQRVAIELANTPDARERHAIDTARAKLVTDELVPLRRERLQRERE